MSSITEAAGERVLDAFAGGRLQAMKDEEREVTETVNVNMPVEPLAYLKITGLTVPDGA